MSSELFQAIAALQEPGLGMGMDWGPRNAAKKLAELGGDEAVDALIHALQNHPNDSVRMEAAGALARIGDPRALPSLEKAANSDSSWMNVRPMAEIAVQEIKKKQANQ
jgi:HEAT repeat protein